ncbi:hypothetical protein [Terrihalobacillus insolitus]|uniref:hypothetical protein n=1 Tax=Terrihalobacillus insolitus TaxID=2950438 RepID=UPI002341FD3F|nr:hypothetical protein [Terrihalobacillus insolitus]MDC3414250.1 hypothetical protein [Terrihalobacillus insolitus]
MLIISSIGITLVTMSYLENKGKISINPIILYIMLISLAIIGGWWGFNKITATFLL